MNVSSNSASKTFKNNNNKNIYPHNKQTFHMDISEQIFRD